jgi:NAD(P)-dependent dehydrogenase (short-subunit alcohol dehydrogenase family)
MRLVGKVALVTGAGSGMGRLATLVFAEQGAKVIASDISQKGLDETMNGIGSALHASILPVTGSVADSDAVRGWIEAGVKQFGSLNVLYNNAGIMPDEDTSVIETSEETFDRVTAANQKGVFLCCKHGVPALIDAGGGFHHQHRVVRRSGGLQRAAGRLHDEQGWSDIADALAGGAIRTEEDPRQRDLPGSGLDAHDGDALFQRGGEDEAAQSHPARPIRTRRGHRLGGRLSRVGRIILDDRPELRD